MQESFHPFDNHDQYTHATGNGAETASRVTATQAAASGLEFKTSKLSLDDSNGLSKNRSYGQENGAESGVDHASLDSASISGKASSSIGSGRINGTVKNQTAGGALVEDQEFDGTLDDLNKDLPPHACR